ncbi:MAG TPA: replication-associated recombination protein A [Bdellovibrionales bacterium]|nr:replication-associated recombination protein A [Bdellovibrionales bacterium]
MDLFENAAKGQVSPGTPLAETLRPKTLHEILGQKKFLAPKSALRQQIEAGQIPSLIIWGPPGSGKTTFARALAEHINAEFIICNAIETGAKTLRELGDDSRRRRLTHARQTLIFVDEIHRLNKAQQDVLLPFVEKGDFILVGATTENPSFELNSALLSRCRLIVFEKLKSEELKQIFMRAMDHFKLGAAEVIEDEALDLLIAYADGDARRLLNQIESVVFYVRSQGLDKPLQVSDLKKVLTTSPLMYDKKGDAHYDTISAFIKSIRGTAPDAALYYLARMLEAGEDPVFIARRLVILASEDVGNADPRALLVAVAAADAVQFVGLPECAINLAQAVTYLASAPKSNRSYMGWLGAQEEVRRSGSLPIPFHLRNAPTDTMKNLGYGSGYKYAHDDDRGWVEQQHLPDAIKDKEFYQPSNHGYEKNIAQFLSALKSSHRREPKND